MNRREALKAGAAVLLGGPAVANSPIGEKPVWVDESVNPHIYEAVMRDEWPSYRFLRGGNRPWHKTNPGMVEVAKAVVDGMDFTVTPGSRRSGDAGVA